MFAGSMNFDLGEDIAALRDMVQGWARDRLAPIAAEVDRDNQFPNELWAEMGTLGLLGVTVSEEFGGAGMGYLAHVVVTEEIARVSASIALSSTRRPTTSPCATATSAVRAISTEPGRSQC